MAAAFRKRVDKISEHRMKLIDDIDAKKLTYDKMVAKKLELDNMEQTLISESTKHKNGNIFIGSMRMMGMGLNQMIDELIEKSKC